MCYLFTPEVISQCQMDFIGSSNMWKVKLSHKLWKLWRTYNVHQTGV